MEMIPPERALVCAHPELYELPPHPLRFRYREAVCPCCHWRGAVRIPLSHALDLDAYVAACIGFTFGTRWADHLYKSRLHHR